MMRFEVVATNNFSLTRDITLKFEQMILSMV